MPIPEIAVVVETDTSWGRNLVRGVASFAQRFGPWNVTVESPERSLGWTRHESPGADGVIVRLSTPLDLQQARSIGVPVVDVGDLFPDAEGIDAVRTDFHAWASIALEHFQSKGFQRFAFYAPPSRDYSGQRAAAFEAAVTRIGAECFQYRPGYRVGREISRDEHRRRVGRWLFRLPSPVAVLAVDARRAKDLAEVCAVVGRSAPDQIAILAGDSDELACEVCTPPLSSIDVASRRIGYAAANRLAARLLGEGPAEGPTLIPPEGVQQRQSTDLFAVEDPTLVRALRYMQRHACRGVTVDHVLAEVPVTRRQLERQFRKHLGRLPAEELRRLRLEHGRRLLVESDLSIEAIAEASGYAGATQFGAAFRRSFGLTPLAYRRRNSGEDPVSQAMEK